MRQCWKETVWALGFQGVSYFCYLNRPITIRLNSVVSQSELEAIYAPKAHEILGLVRCTENQESCPLAGTYVYIFILYTLSPKYTKHGLSQCRIRHELLLVLSIFDVSGNRWRGSSAVYRLHGGNLVRVEQTWRDFVIKVDAGELHVSGFISCYWLNHVFPATSWVIFMVHAWRVLLAATVAPFGKNTWFNSGRQLYEMLGAFVYEYFQKPLGSKTVSCWGREKW